MKHINKNTKNKLDEGMKLWLYIFSGLGLFLFGLQIGSENSIDYENLNNYNRNQYYECKYDLSQLEKNFEEFKFNNNHNLLKLYSVYLEQGYLNRDNLNVTVPNKIIEVRTTIQ